MCYILNHTILLCYIYSNNIWSKLSHYAVSPSLLQLPLISKYFHQNHKFRHKVFVCKTPPCVLPVHNHSFRSLSYDRSKASSKASSPQRNK
jgi:hypothetical protein